MSNEMFTHDQLLEAAEDTWGNTQRELLESFVLALSGYKIRRLSAAIAFLRAFQGSVDTACPAGMTDSRESFESRMVKFMAELWD